MLKLINKLKDEINIILYYIFNEKYNNKFNYY